MDQENNQTVVQPADKAKIRNFIYVTLILLGVTILEYVIAFNVSSDSASMRWTRAIVFILLTLVKAGFIVSEFMHLGHEKRSLKLSIYLPIIFVMFFIAIMIYQGSAIFNVLVGR